jgi:hypothetical protein
MKINDEMKYRKHWQARPASIETGVKMAVMRRMQCILAEIAINIMKAVGFSL